jgi:hypothetical protein
MAPAKGATDWRLQDDRLLALVVLRNVAIGPAAEALAMTKPLASQKLVEALDLLVRHFDLGERRRAA